MMSKVLGIFVKTICTEAIIKKIVIILIDYLVKSSKNKLDDKLWAPIKAKL